MSETQSTAFSTGSTTWSEEDDRAKRHEAIWKQSCSRTHSLWCSCGDWTSHIRGWRTTGDGGDGNRNAGDSGDGNGGGDPGPVETR